jgi:hypothetical protein
MLSTIARGSSYFFLMILFLALFFASYAWFAGRALAATIKLQGKFKVDVPISAPDQRTD